MTIKNYIRTIPNFPHEGIMFRDVTTLFGDPKGFSMAVDQMIERFSDREFDKIAGLEARGFILGGAMAHRMGKGFIPVRKKGKLPGTVISEDYDLEYGKATLEVHVDSISAGERVLIIDDLLATGGTATAGINLMERLDGTVIGCGLIIDLPELGGGDKLRGAGHDVEILCAFEGA